MGIIKAVANAIGGGFADQWLEVYEANDMGERTVFTDGVLIRKGQNTKGTNNTVSNGSIIHVYDNQFMMLVDGGKVVDYTAEPGYYKVDNSSMPSLFNGELGETVKETFSRIKFGGQTPTMQKVFFINLQEIKGIKFGTRNPINYFDNFYNAELFLRAHGTYSVKITNPLQFYAEVIPRNKDRVDFEEIGDQYISEFLEALQSAINQMSADGTRISYVTSKAMELGKYMQDILDEEWNQLRGMEIQKVGIASVSYDEESQKLINMRNEGAMLGSDFNVMRGMAVKNLTEGVRDAGSNAGGAMNGFMGVGMGMNAMNQTLSGLGAMQTPADMQRMGMQQGGMNPGMQQNGVNAGMQGGMNAGMQQNGVNPGMQGQTMNMGMQQGVASGMAQGAGWTCACGHVNTGKFCSECGKPMPAPAASEWTCVCGHVNTGKFCSECGKPAPTAAPAEWTCECGTVNAGKFCSNCGKARN
ncbi:MAG: SPFH domain-containing protein [Roseburia sp.]|nr:SPFH domain-containing protein [Roseburia sp.]